MKILVTGSAGFLGRQLVLALAQQGHAVIAVVRKESDIEEVKNVKYVVADIFREDAYSKLGFYTADIFIHLAWFGTAGEQRANVEKQIDNIKFSCKLLELAKKIGCRRFVFAGSIMEYEAVKYVPKDNVELPMGMIYSTAKLTADFMLKIYAQKISIEYVNVIISNIYGPNECSARFLNQTMKKMIKGEVIKLTKSDQLYDFIYISDAIKAIILVVFRGRDNNAYYIGSSNPVPLKNYVLQMKTILNSESELQFGVIPYNNAKLTYCEFDTKKLEREFGYKCDYTFEQGIKEIMRYEYDK